MPTYAEPPRTLQEMLDRKEQARRRFDDVPLFEKMELAIRMYHDRARMLRSMAASVARG